MDEEELMLGLKLSSNQFRSFSAKIHKLKKLLIRE